MSDDKGKAVYKRDRRREATERARKTSVPVSVDAYSLASQRRAIAYGRARGRS